MLAPIILFAYARPKHLTKTIQALVKNKEALESNLYVFVDGLKQNASEVTIQNHIEVNNYVESIKGFKKVTVYKSLENKGLARSIIAGVTHIIEKYKVAIVLEDDLIVSEHFLTYMNKALDTYAFNEKVMQIGGYQFSVPDDGSNFFVHLQSFTSSWGWATWKRAWDHFLPNADGFERLLSNKSLASKFNLHGAYPYTQMLQKQMLTKTIDSWAVRWYYSVFIKKGLVLYPSKSLVYNNGFDESATHTKHALTQKSSESELMKEAVETAFNITKTSIDKKVFKQVQQYLKKEMQLNPHQKISFFIKKKWQNTKAKVMSKLWIPLKK